MSFFPRAQKRIIPAPKPETRVETQVEPVRVEPVEKPEMVQRLEKINRTADRDWGIDPVPGAVIQADEYNRRFPYIWGTEPGLLEIEPDSDQE